MQKTDVTYSASPIPLSGSELNRLGAFLQQFPGAMNLEMIDGFFTALICMPHTSTVHSLVALVLGAEAKFNSAEDAYEITNLIMRHWNTILQTLKEGDYHYPLLLEDGNGMVHANDWAQGFNMGMQFIYKDWSTALNDQTYLSWMLPILALAHENTPEWHPLRIDNAQRQKLLFDLVVGVKKIHDYFLPQTRTAGHKTASPQQSEKTLIKCNKFEQSGIERKYPHRYGNKTDRPLYSPTLH